MTRRDLGMGSYNLAVLALVLADPHTAPADPHCRSETTLPASGRLFSKSF